MNLNTMTTNERERLAYAEGFVETAKLFARLDDMQRALGESVADMGESESTVEERQQRYRDLVEERDALFDEYQTLQTQRDDLQEENDSLFESYQTMRAERDELRVALKLAIDQLQDGEQMRALDTMRAVVW